MNPEQKNYRMKRLLNLLPVLFALQAAAQPPAGYYNAASGLSGTALQSALHDIIDNHTVISYSGLWTAFQTTDDLPNGRVWDMYSNCTWTFVTDQCGNYNSECDCYNREHSWPKSWFDDQAPMNSDLFHIYPTDGWVNNKRGNYPFGTVSNPTYISGNGSRVGNCSYPGYSGVVFEPLNEYKGDFARTYFYMSVRYYGEDAGWPGSDQVTGSQLRPWALAMMLEWHAGDPVSTKETERNDAVYALQNNRNPFIDHPEFALQIWGNPTAVDFTAINSNIRVYPVPASVYCIVDHNGYYTSRDLSISLTDLSGRQYTASSTVDEYSVNINTSSLAPGFYIISLQQAGKMPAFVRIIK